MTRITHASRELVERAREISALSRLISATKDSLRSHSFSSFVASRSIASLFRARGLEAGKSCIRAMMHSRTLQGARSRAESEMDGLLISWVISSLAFQPLACYCRAIPLIRIRALRVPIACLFPDPPVHYVNFRAERHPSHATRIARQKKSEQDRSNWESCLSEPVQRSDVHIFYCTEAPMQ